MFEFHGMDVRGESMDVSEPFRPIWNKVTKEDIMAKTDGACTLYLCMRMDTDDYNAIVH